MATNTYDNKQIISHFGLKDVDKGFYDWWDKKLDLHYVNKDGEKKKLPVLFMTSERWFKSRIEGVRNKQGQLILPLLVIARTAVSDSTSGPTSRQFADTQEEAYTIARQAHPKSSIVKNLVQSRSKNIDPNFPIYEMFTAPVPDHYSLTYEVDIWTSYVDDMNDFIQKIGQEMNFKSKKMFKFDINNGMYFVAFKDEELNDDSNMEDFSDSERIVKKEYRFNVSAHIIPENKQRPNSFRRYLSQTKLVIKSETIISDEEDIF